MTSAVLFFPCASKAASEHYKNTVERPVRIAGHRDLLDPEAFELASRVAVDGRLPIWGIQAGASRQKKAHIARIVPGDVCVFTAEGRGFAIGIVMGTTESAELGRALWSTDGVGETWEHIVFLREVQPVQIPYSTLAAWAGYNPAFSFQNFIRREHPECAERLLREARFLGEAPEVSTGRCQGRGLTSGARRAVEEHAVARAVVAYPEIQLSDVGATKSWDLEGTRGGISLRIEVKGSTGSLDKIILTRNEVTHAQAAREGGEYQLALVLVSGISLKPAEGPDQWAASGGVMKVLDPWIIVDSRLSATQYEYSAEEL